MRDSIGIEKIRFLVALLLRPLEGATVDTPRLLRNSTESVKKQHETSADHCLEMPERIVLLGERLRERVLAELHLHYREELGMKEYAGRLGEIASVVSLMMVSAH